MTPQELETVKIGKRVFHRIEEEVITILSTNGFIKDGEKYIPCADSRNNIDDYRVSDLVIF